MSPPDSALGRRLHALLPAVYRNRDRDAAPGRDRHLARYLDACGELLDLIRHTLDQRLADSFPDNPRQGLACQDWVLPYFADLLDVELVSPHVEGRREEVSRAVAWRQRKGTPPMIEELAEAVGQRETELHEGFERVALTPRLDRPLLPATALGAGAEPDPDNPLEAARHPGLPAVTVDFGRPSRAVRTTAANPVARVTDFGGGEVHWRQVNPHGAPCFPGSYEDRSRRTVDLRTPDWRRGHHHPRRLLLFTPPPTGFFPPGQVSFIWSERHSSAHEDHFAAVPEDEPDPEVIYNPSAAAGVAVTITTRPPNFTADHLRRIAGLNFLDTLTFDAGRLELEGVAARRIVVKSPPGTQPVFKATNCLFETVIIQNGLAELDRCTVTRRLACDKLRASDSIFTGKVLIRDQGGDPESCVRYSRLPAAWIVVAGVLRLFDSAPRPLEELPETWLRRHQNTSDPPIFYDFKTCDDSGSERSASLFGAPGHGVLHPATSDTICFGAEDGGEMGAYHQRRYCLQNAAVLDKLEDFLPLGIEAALIPDPRLLQPPPSGGE